MNACDQHDGSVSVRYLVDDVEAAVDFYTAHLGFAVHTIELFQPTHQPEASSPTR